MNERTLNGKQPNEVAAMPQQKGESHNRCAEYHELRQCRKAQGDKTQEEHEFKRSSHNGWQRQAPSTAGAAHVPES